MERMKYRTGFASIFDFEGEIFPLIKSPEDVALVDIGGSLGHVLEDIQTHLPGLKGRLVLEELPETLKSVDLPKDIESVEYNFLEKELPAYQKSTPSLFGSHFRTNSSTGATCYLFRQIFLNWSDAKGLQILHNTLPSMTPGHSRLLIMEPVLPLVSAPMPAALVDIQMMQMGGGLRTQK
jgi:hypothetical protein